MTTLSESLKTIGARLCLSEETQIDGRQLLARAEQAAAMESELATIHESADEVCLALNDQLTALQALVGTLQKRPTLPVDGQNGQHDRRRD